MVLLVSPAKREFMCDLQEKSLTSSAGSAKEKTYELPNRAVFFTGAERALFPEVLFLPSYNGEKSSTVVSGRSCCAFEHWQGKAIWEKFVGSRVEKILDLECLVVYRENIILVCVRGRHQVSWIAAE